MYSPANSTDFIFASQFQATHVFNKKWSQRLTNPILMPTQTPNVAASSQIKTHTHTHKKEIKYHGRQHNSCLLPIG